MQNAPEGPHEDSHENAPRKFDGVHEHVDESVLGQFSHVLLSHVLFLPRRAIRSLNAHQVTSLLFETNS